MDVIGDVRFEDPFRCLEDESPDVKAWERRLDAQARETLTSSSGYSALVDALRRHLGACSTPPPRRGGLKWFSSSFDDGRQRHIYVSDDIRGPRRLLVDVGGLVSGANPSIDFFVPSPNGAMMAVGVSTSGDEQSILHLLDGRTGATLGAPVGVASGGKLAWLPDSTGLYCVVSPGGDRASVCNDLVFVQPGCCPVDVDVPRRLDESRLTVQVSSDGRYVAVGSDPISPRVLCVLDRYRRVWQAGPALARGIVFWGVFVGDRYIAVTTLDAPRGCLVSAPVDRFDDRGTWDVLREEQGCVLRSVALAGDQLVLFDFSRGAARISIARTDGTVIDEVPLERPGLPTTNPRNPGQYGADSPAVVDSAGLTFNYASVDRAPAVLRYEFSSGALSSVSRSKCSVDNVTTCHGSCRSADGVSVDYRIVGRATAIGGAVPQPTVIAAYGGWNSMTSSAGYLGPLAPFVEAGGTIVFANLRGDATDGADQWFAGRRENKQRTFDDLYAVAETLIARGDTAPGMLGVFGGSNGGLLVGVAVTQRPELFKAVVGLVPILDMARMLRERFMEIGLTEYGDPRVPSEAAWLRAYSPYHNVQRGGEHPATLFVCGACDVRCHPWHARKMVAALHERQPEGPPVMLRVHADCGHLSAGPLGTAAITAEWLGFLMRELGIDYPGASFERPSCELAQSSPT